ncbi:MAG: extracellular solute-binding protein, partial [Clostridia bacterium]|nr:extracellular solute-binding protein [Clostridia bacterium]
MKKAKATKFLALFLGVLMLCGSFVIPVSASSGQESGVIDTKLVKNTSDSYTSYIEKYADRAKGEKEISIDITDYYLVEGEDYSEEVKLSYADDETLLGLFTPDSGAITWEVDMTDLASGLYGIRIEYLPVSANIASIERELYIDNKAPFSQARYLTMSKNWIYMYDKLDGNGNAIFRQDVAGNDIRSEIVNSPVWRTYECTDADGFFSGAFQFYFAGGEKHTITLRGVRESMLIHSITLFPVEDVPSYSEYAQSNSDKSPAKGSIVFVEAESPFSVSDTSVYPANDRSSAANSPTSATSQRINTIGTKGYSTVGQWAMYQFKVTADGLYNINMRYRQSALAGMFVSRSLKLWSDDGKYGFWFETDDADVAAFYPHVIERADGTYLVSDGTPTIPFAEADGIRYDYSDDWQSSLIGKNGTPFAFYFEEGVQYEMTWEVALGDLAEILGTVERSLSVINESYLTILKLTGPEPDKYRDYGFTRIMPATVRALWQQSQILYNVSAELSKLCGTKGSHVATLDKVAQLLELMGSDESKIAANLSTLKSYIGTLGTWLMSSKTQSLTVDSFSIAPVGTGEKQLPRANANIFSSIWFEVKSFFVSFFVDYNSMGIVEGGEATENIDVWLAYGRDQSLIWRNLVDNEFTPNSGIAVALKLVAGGTLLPSVLAGQGPDVYIGLDATNTLNYAIRNAVVDIQDMEGFEDVLGYKTYDMKTDTYYDSKGAVVDPATITFTGSSIVPLTLYGKTYGLPETNSFSMMFYRTDILEELGIEVPETWDDVLEAVPQLQANNMQIGLAYATAMNIFLYQYGGSLWLYEDDEEYAGAQIGLATDEALDSFVDCTRLYTDYSFPVAYDGPNRFRTGEMPLLISDYITTYNQLIVFATEIKGLWAFTSVPGKVADNRQSIAAVTSTIMLHDDERTESKTKAAWEFMKWQVGDDVQASYGNEMVALVGPAAKYATANLRALQDLSWTHAEYKALIDQFYNLASI